MDMFACTPVELKYWKTWAKTFNIPAKQYQFMQENNFNIAPFRRFAMAMNTMDREMKIHSGFSNLISDNIEYSQDGSH